MVSSAKREPRHPQLYVAQPCPRPCLIQGSRLAKVIAETHPENASSAMPASHPSRTLVALASSCLRRPLGVSVAGSSPRRQRTLGYAREWTVKKSMKGYGHLPRIEPAPRAASHARYAPRRDFLDPELGAEK